MGSFILYKQEKIVPTNSAKFAVACEIEFCCRNFSSFSESVYIILQMFAYDVWKLLFIFAFRQKEFINPCTEIWNWLTWKEQTFVIAM